MDVPNQMDSIYAGDNNFNNGKFGYNNLATGRRNLDTQIQRQDLYGNRGVVHVYERRNRPSDKGGSVSKAARFRCEVDMRRNGRC
jgi:hypothetical protein